jgi:hypothetical protein
MKTKLPAPGRLLPQRIADEHHWHGHWVPRIADEHRWNDCCRNTSRMNITSTAAGCLESRMNITGTGTRETASKINTSDRQSSATPSAGSVAFNASVTREIHSSCNRPQHRWLPGIAECTLVTKSTHAIRKPSSAARSQHVPSWQGNEIPTIWSGNIQAQQKAQHQTAFSSDIERYCQNNSQPQVASVALLSTPCNLVYNRPVGAEGLEPPTSWV